MLKKLSRQQSLRLNGLPVIRAIYEADERISRQSLCTMWFYDGASTALFGVAVAIAAGPTDSIRQVSRPSFYPGSGSAPAVGGYGDPGKLRSIKNSQS